MTVAFALVLAVTSYVAATRALGADVSTCERFAAESAARAEQVTGRGERVVVIGDSWSADVVGATGAGWRAIYYPSRAATPPVFDDPRIRVACTADEARAVLSDFGV